MSMEWETLAGEERAAFWVAADFLEGRLSDSATVEWALTLGHRRRAERLAVAHVLRKQRAMTVGEPWSSIWGLIEQSWAREPVEQTSSMVYEIEGRLSGGDRSGALVAMIGRLVAPRIEVSLGRSGVPQGAGSARNHRRPRPGISDERAARDAEGYRARPSGRDTVPHRSGACA